MSATELGNNRSGLSAENYTVVPTDDSVSMNFESASIGWPH